jgi:hypothetical protein
MDKYYILVSGSGKTSRINIEALLDDHFFANAGEPVVVIPVEDKVSDGQIWAAQFSAEKEKKVLVYSKTEVSALKIHGVSLELSDDPVKEAITDFKQNKVAAFLLWNDEDEDCLRTLKYCHDNSVPVFDLTDGLREVKNVKSITIQEKSTPPKEEVDGVLTLEQEDEEYEEEYEETAEEALYAAVQEIARIFVEMISEEIAEVIQKEIKKSKRDD